MVCHLKKQEKIRDLTKNYFAEIKDKKSLTMDKISFLARCVQQGDNQARQEKIIEPYLCLVVRFARQYRGQGVSFADLIKEENVGLMKAVKNFRPAKNLLFFYRLSMGLNNQ